MFPLLPSRWPGSPQGSNFTAGFLVKINGAESVLGAEEWAMESRSVSWECSPADTRAGCECGSPFGILSGSENYLPRCEIHLCLMLPFSYVRFTFHTTRVFYHSWPQCSQPAGDARLARVLLSPAVTHTSTDARRCSVPKLFVKPP